MAIVNYRFNRLDRFQSTATASCSVDIEWKPEYRDLKHAAKMNPRPYECRGAGDSANEALASAYNRCEIDACFVIRYSIESDPWVKRVNGCSCEIVKSEVVDKVEVKRRQREEDPLVKLDKELDLLVGNVIDSLQNAAVSLWHCAFS